MPPSPNGVAYSNPNPPSRYDIYREEIERGYNKLYSMTGSSTSGGNGEETGLPRCAERTSVSGVDTTTGSVDRRVIYGAVMNCIANDLRPGSNNQYHAMAFAKFFLVRPVTADNTLWTELIDIIQPGDSDGVARDIVQLYR